MINKTIIRILEAIPRLLVFFSIIYLASALTTSYLVDVQGIYIQRISEWVIDQGGNVPLLWFHAFRDASPTEYIQWSLLGLSILLIIILGGLQLKVRAKFPWMWILLFVGLTFMLIEDITDARHYIGSFFAEYVFQVDHTALDWQTGSWKSLIEISIYFLLGSIMIVSLIIILRDKKLSLSGKKMLITGYFFYGAASVSSATRHLGSWYMKAGDVLVNFINSGMTMKVEDSFQREYLGYHFMDFVIEESLELLGATFIAAALTAFIALMLKKYKPKA